MLPITCWYLTTSPKMSNNSQLITIGFHIINKMSYYQSISYDIWEMQSIRLGIVYPTH